MKSCARVVDGTVSESALAGETGTGGRDVGRAAMMSVPFFSTRRGQKLMEQSGRHQRVARNPPRAFPDFATVLYLKCKRKVV